MADKKDKSRYYSDGSYTNGNGPYTSGDSRYYTGGGGYYTGGYYTGGGGYYTGGGGYYAGGGGYYTGGNNPMMPKKKEDGSQIDIKEWTMRFLGYWHLFVIGVVVAMCVGYLVTRSWMPEYTTESKIIIQESEKSSGINFMQGFMGGMDYTNANNQLLVLGSYKLINRTIKKLPFGVDYFQRGHFKTYSLYGREPICILVDELSPDAYSFVYKFHPINANSFEISIESAGDKSHEKFADTFHPIKANYGSDISCVLFSMTVQKLYMMPEQDDFYFSFRTERSLEDEFAGRLEVAYLGSTKDPSTVVSLTLTSSDTQRDQDFLNMLSKEFLAANLEEKNEEANRTIEFINEQLFMLSDSLNYSEAQLRQYRAVNNLVDISSYSSQVISKLNELDNKRSEMALKEAYFDALSKYLTQSVMDEKLVAPSSIGVADPTLLELVSQFNELQQRRSDLGEKNPQYGRYTKRMDEIRQTLLEVLKNVRKVHEMERKEFEREYGAVTAEIKNLPEKEFEMVNYERQYKINDNYYTFLLQKKSEAQIRKASNVPDNKILQDARTTLYPVNTRDKMMKFLICLLLGLLIPAGYVILKFLLETKIHTEDDLLKLTDAPLIGAVLHTDSKERVVVTKNKKSVFTEKYRILRQRIEILSQKKNDILITVTSSESGDGKSHFSMNLAGVFSMVSDKVLLMDMDLRNPNASRKSGYGSAKGIVHYLIGDAELDDVIVKIDDQFGFDFIPVGVVPMNAAELIRSDKMVETLAELKSRYDYIIVDTSPVGLVADAVEIMRQAEVNLIVTRARKTNKNFFKNFMIQLSMDKIENMYVVLNDIPVVNRKKKGLLGKLGSYGYGYYGQRYGYGYGGGYGYGYGYTGGSYASHYYNDHDRSKYYTSDEGDGNTGDEKKQ